MHFKEFLSLILKEKELKQKQIFIATFFLFCTFQSRSIHSKKEKCFQEKKGFQTTYPNFFQAVT